MAKIQEEIIVIKVSRLLRDSAQDSSPILAPEAVESLEAVITELAGAAVMVEVEKT